MKQYIVEIDEEIIKKKSPSKIEDLIYDAIDFYLYGGISDRKYIKVKRLTYGVK